MSAGKYPVGVTDKLKADEPMKIKTLKKNFVAQISDIDLSQPLNEPVLRLYNKRSTHRALPLSGGSFSMMKV
jgi:hypothetical protein